MTCRDCGQSLFVERTIDSSALTVRIHRCECGSRWESAQKITKRLPSITVLTAANSSLIAARQQPNSSPLAGVLLDLDPISSSGPQSNPDPDRAPAKVPRRKKQTIEYPPEFDGFWAACESNRSKGLKGEALQAWVAAGRPDCVMLLDKWRQFRAAQGDTLCKDVCRWIKFGGHLQEYQPAPPIPRQLGGRPVAKPAPYHAPLPSLPGLRAWATDLKPRGAHRDGDGDALAPPPWMQMADGPKGAS